MAFARRTRVYHVETLVHAERQTTETPWHQEQEEPEQHAYSAQNPRQHAGHTFYVRHDVCLERKLVEWSAGCMLEFHANENRRLLIACAV